MVNILAFDCSTDACSVALNIDGIIKQKFHLQAREHNKLILPLTEQLLRENQLQFKDLNAIAFACGPGSFTGIRLAASVAQAFAFANNIPIIPISTLKTLAETSHRKHAVTKVYCALDARMDEIYLAGYEFNSSGCAVFLAEKLVPVTEIKNYIDADGYAVGDAWQNYFAVFNGPDLQICSITENEPKNKEKIRLTLLEKIYPEAYDVAVLAEIEFNKGNALPAEAGLPVYLREMNYKKII